MTATSSLPHFGRRRPGWRVSAPGPMDTTGLMEPGKQPHDFGQPLRTFWTTVRFRHFGVSLSRDCFAHAASITRRTTVRFRYFGVSLSIRHFSFTIIPDILAPRSAFPAFTTFLAFLFRIRGTRKRGTLPHSRASSFRHFGVSLSTTDLGIWEF